MQCPNNNLKLCKKASLQRPKNNLNLCKKSWLKQMQWCTMYIVQYVQYVQYVFSARHNLYVYIHTTPTVRGSALEQRFRFFLGQCILVGVPLYIFYHNHLEIGFFFVQQCPTLLVVLHTYFFHTSYCNKQFLRNKRQDRQ